MQNKKIDSWEQFKEQLEILKEKYSQLINSAGTYPEHFLFRGHARRGWKLETTLERSCNEKNMALSHFNQLLRKQIAKFKKQHNECLLCKRSNDWTTCIDLPILRKIPGYNCMACLRQNGFPSPLLDWSKSPCIAARFAFNDASIDQTEDVSIFVFLETAGIGKSFCHDRPHIRSLGHTIETDPKHDELDSEYTICVAQYNDEWYFTFHEDAFAHAQQGQDYLWKFNIPVTERQKVLARWDLTLEKGME